MTATITRGASTGNGPAIHRPPHQQHWWDYA